MFWADWRADDSSRLCPETDYQLSQYTLRRAYVLWNCLIGCVYPCKEFVNG